VGWLFEKGEKKGKRKNKKNTAMVDFRKWFQEFRQLGRRDRRAGHHEVYL